MYEKLGELLNEALENGEIPQFDTTNNESRNFFENSMNNQNSKDPGSFYVKKSTNQAENQNAQRNFASNTENSDEKLYKYADFMHFPYNIRQILGTLHIAYPFSWIKLRQKLLQEIKNQHPDTKNTIQNSKSVQNFKHLDVNTLISYYRELNGFFKIKEQDR